MNPFADPPATEPAGGKSDGVVAEPRRYPCPSDRRRDRSWRRRSGPGWVSSNFTPASSPGAENRCRVAGAGRLRLRLGGWALRVPPARRSSPRSAFPRLEPPPIQIGVPRRKTLRQGRLRDSTTLVAAAIAPRSCSAGRSRAVAASSASRVGAAGQPRRPLTTNGPRSTTSPRTPCICLTARVWKPIRVWATGSTTPVSSMSAITARRRRTSINSRCANRSFMGFRRCA